MTKILIVKWISLFRFCIEASSRRIYFAVGARKNGVLVQAKAKLTSVVLIACVGTSVASVSTAQVTNEDLAKSWGSNKFHSLRVSWTESRLVPAGSMPALGAGRTMDEAHLLPASDTVISVKCVLSLSGDRLRYETNGKMWDAEVLGFSERRYVCTFNGSDSRSFYGADPSDDSFHDTGFVNKDKRNMESTNPLLFPVTINYHRPDLSDLILTKQAEIKGHVCAVLQDVSGIGGTGGLSHEFWTDPQLGFSIVRHVSYVQGKQYYQTDITYSKDSSNRWQPVGWKSQRIDPQTSALREQVEASVTEFEIDVQFADTDFLFQFPPGTEIIDRVAKKRFIATIDGGRRELSSVEARSLPRYKYLTTVAGENAVRNISNTSLSRWTVIGINGLCLLLVIAVLVFRRYNLKGVSK